MKHTWITLVFCLCVTPASQAGREEIDRFLRDYPGAASRIDAGLAQVRGSCRLKLQRARNPDRYDIDKATFAVDHGFRKVTIRRDRTRGKAKVHADIVYCIGEATAFSLARPTGSGAYAVQGIGSDHRDRIAFDTLFGRFLSAPYSVLGVPLPRIMAYPTFHLTSAEVVEVAGKRLFRIDYEIGKAEKVDKVWLLLDPESGWVIRCGEIRFGNFPGAKVTFDIEYGPYSGSLPFPRLVTFNDPNNLESTCEFESISHEATPEREFTMGYYGLADLTRPGVASSGSGRIYWLAGLGVLGLVAALALRRLASHRISN